RPLSHSGEGLGEGEPVRSDAGGGAHAVEAGATVDWPVLPGQEGHGRHCAALVASHRMEGTRRLTVALAAAVRAALRTPLRLVRQTLLGEERLLSCREYERDA